MSTVPNFWIVLEIIELTSNSCEMSARIARAWRPRASISFAAALISPRVRAATTTRAPACARARATALPIPLPEPVTMATLSVSSIAGMREPPSFDVSQERTDDDLIEHRVARHTVCRKDRFRHAGRPHHAARVFPAARRAPHRGLRRSRHDVHDFHPPMLDLLPEDPAEPEHPRLRRGIRSGTLKRLDGGIRDDIEDPSFPPPHHRGEDRLDAGDLPEKIRRNDCVEFRERGVEEGFEDSDTRAVHNDIDFSPFFPDPACRCGGRTGSADVARVGVGFSPIRRDRANSRAESRYAARGEADHTADRGKMRRNLTPYPSGGANDPDNGSAKAGGVRAFRHIRRGCPISESETRSASGRPRGTSRASRSSSPLNSASPRPA